MTEQELLLQEAKAAYYEGNPLMGDEEYDALERSLGLENKSEVGYHSENYTVKHPFTMGSLSKVQIKNNDKTWEEYSDQIKKYIGSRMFEITPKYDGCSFEVVAEVTPNHCLEILTVSTRGDGEYGKDITCHIVDQVNEFFYKFETCKFKKITNMLQTPGVKYVFRGEVLVSFDTYNKYFSEEFVNTRAFVAGVLNRPESTPEDRYLDLKVYDIRTIDGHHIDLVTDRLPIPELTHARVLDNLSGTSLEKIYSYQEALRAQSEYPLDGFVIKTICKDRSEAFDARPKDCVAIKFKPEIKDTVITDIEWTLSSKNGEYYPVGIIDDVILDSKKVNRVSLANYGKVTEQGLAPGAKVRISMAGDIIPYLYEVVERSDNFVWYPEDTYVQGVHLYKRLTPTEMTRQNFLASCEVLQVPGLGPSMAEDLFTFDDTCENILLFDWDGYSQKMHVSRNVAKVRTAFYKVISEYSLAQVIQSLNIPGCGARMSTQCAYYIQDRPHDFASMASKGYDWIYDKSSSENVRLRKILAHINREDLLETVGDLPEPMKLKVILTGSPKEFGYANKGEFMKAHPDFEETSKMSEATCLITDDLTSTSSKMKKAEKAGIKIMTYGDF